MVFEREGRGNGARQIEETDRQTRSAEEVKWMCSLRGATFVFMRWMAE
jgi:hypothetical protein